jgi:hypothetical protein
MMKILFWLEPHFELSCPGITQGWLGWFERMANGLMAADVQVDFRVVSLDTAPAAARQAALGSRLLLLSQAELRANWQLTGDAFTLLEHDEASPGAVASLAILLQERLAGFEPNYVFLLNQQPWLRRVFPHAMFINTEVSWISRAPFPMSWQLDVVGAGKCRVLAEFSDALLAGLTLDAHAESLVDEFEKTARANLVFSGVDDFLHPLRHRFVKLVLLPLGVIDRFDGQTPFFTLLDKYLGEQDGRACFIVSQHPTLKLISNEQLAYLCSRYAHVQSAGKWGSQQLLPLVDQVVGDFSTVANQALFFDTQVTSIRHQLSFFRSDSPLCNPLVDLLLDLDQNKRRRLLYWLLTRYAVPEEKLFDGYWLLQFLLRARQAQTEGAPWRAYEAVTTFSGDWAAAKWVTSVTAPYLEARLYWVEKDAQPGAGFTEHSSQGAGYLPTGERQTVKLVFPKQVDSVSRIRLDIANEPVGILLHELFLEDEAQNVFWRWDVNLAQFQSRLHVSFLSASNGNPPVIFSLSGDPQFVIDLPEAVLASIKPGCALVLSLTANSLVRQLPEVLASAEALNLKNQTYEKSELQRREELIRAEAQLQLLKELLLGDSEPERL